MTENRNFQCGCKKNHEMDIPSCSMFADKVDSGGIDPEGQDSAPKRRRRGRRAAGSRRMHQKAGSKRRSRRHTKRSYKARGRGRKSRAK